jgi:hypothetical protein
MVTSIAARPAQTQMMRPQGAQRLLSLLALMRLLAEARGADVSDKAYEMYALALSEFEDADVKAVVDKIARQPRGEGEKAWPELGALIDPLINMRARRKQQEQLAAERQKEIEFFWNQIVPDRMERFGWTEAELLDRFPTYKGTKPR